MPAAVVRGNAACRGVQMRPSRQPQMRAPSNAMTLTVIFHARSSRRLPRRERKRPTRDACYHRAAKRSS